MTPKPPMHFHTLTAPRNSRPGLRNLDVSRRADFRSPLLAIAALAALIPVVGKAAAINFGFEGGDLSGFTHSGFFNPEGQAGGGGPSSGGPNFQTFVAAEGTGGRRPPTRML